MSLILITSLPELRTHVARLAAASGVGLTQPASIPDVLGVWAGGGLILVGVDAAEDLAALGPPRRSGVHLIGDGPSEASLRAAVALGVESVIELPTSGSRLGQLVSDASEPARVGHMVGVIGGGGGVGASTLACALAQAASRDGLVLLLDVDPLGPGLDRMLGLEEVPGIRWPDLNASSGRLGARALRDSVPRQSGPGVLSWAGGSRVLDPDVAREAVTAATRGHDLVVLDLPRHGDDLTVELARRCDLLLLVCRADLSGLAGATRVVEAFGLQPRSSGLVLRPGPVRADAASRVTGLPVLTHLPDQRRVGEALDLGLGPLVGRRGPLARTVDHLLEVAA